MFMHKAWLIYWQGQDKRLTFQPCLNVVLEKTRYQFLWKSVCFFVWKNKKYQPICSIFESLNIGIAINLKYLVLFGIQSLVILLKNKQKEI